MLLLERGIDYRPATYYGTYLGALIYADRRSLLFTQEGLNIVRPLMVGGATSMYCGCAAPPPDWLAGRYGVDIAEECSETVEELEIAPLRADLRGKASTRLADAARARGYDFQPQLKFMRPGRGPRFTSSAARVACWAVAAAPSGAPLSGWTRRSRPAPTCGRAPGLPVLIEDGHAVGVEGRLAGQPFTAKADTVVLAAGGIVDQR